MGSKELVMPDGVGFGNEALKDYDEGTWTASDASGAGLSIITARGKFVRIGNVVHINGVFGYPVTSNTAVAKITIPIATTNESNIVNVLSGTTITGLVSSSGIQFYNSSAANVTNAGLSNQTVYITGTYNIN